MAKKEELSYHGRFQRIECNVFFQNTLKILLFYCLYIAVKELEAQIIVNPLIVDPLQSSCFLFALKPITCIKKYIKLILGIRVSNKNEINKVN